MDVDKSEQVPAGTPKAQEEKTAEAAAPSSREAWFSCFLRWVTIREQPNRMERAAAALLCLVLILLVWQILTAGEPENRIIDNMTLPSPGETFGSFHSLWFERALARSAVWSLGRVLGGFLLAVAVAVPLGVVASSFRRLRAFLQPVSIFGRNVPVAALIPLTLIWFGLGETQKVMFIFFACLAFVFFDSSNAVDGVPDSYLDTAYTLGARFVPKNGAIWSAVIGLGYALIFLFAYLLLSEAPGKTDPEVLQAAWRSTAILTTVVGFLLGFALWFPILSMQAVRKVLLPLALPDITNSLRLLFGLAFGYIMLAEVINAEHGLGSLIILSQRRGPREHIYLCLIIIALLAYAIDRLILYGQHYFFPYRRSGEN
jgi:ABC-type nitrate/sulfonate/bicarbonate transport system permease component